jgi:hypothetical protein
VHAHLGPLTRALRGHVAAPDRVRQRDPLCQALVRRDRLHAPDKAKCYPPALRALLPAAEHRSSKYLNNGLERDHQFLKGRVQPMRRFKTAATASRFCRGHGLIRNLGCGFTQLAAGAPPRLRLATAWTALAVGL